MTACTQSNGKRAYPSKIVQKSKAMVIGTGNRWRKDDAVGLLVVRCFKKNSPDHVDVLEMPGISTDLLETWKETEAVFIVDAVHSRARPGTIHRFSLHDRPLPADIFSVRSTHTWDIAETIALGRVLGRLPPCLIIYGITGKNFSLGKSLSPEVKQAVPEAVSRLTQEVRKYLISFFQR